MNRSILKIEPNDEKEVRIEASDPYGGEPSITVKEGEVYSFYANHGKTWTDWFWRSSAKGFWNPVLFRWMKRVKSAKCFELCGTIDDEEKYHFKIGMSRENYKIPKTGLLFFFPNDSIKHLCNNKGFMNVNVVRKV